MAAAAPVTMQDAPSHREGDVVVTGARDAPPAAPPLAIDHFVRFCFDPTRLSGAPQSPEIDLAWLPLDERDQRRLGVSDPDRPAYALVDRRVGQTFVIKIDRLTPRPELVEQRCTLLVIGPHDAAALRGAISSLLRGSPTQRHIGHRDGSEGHPGWDEWLWTAIADRGSRVWRAYGQHGSRDGGTGWVVVANSQFYDRSDYVAIDMKRSRDAATATSMVTLVHVTQP